MSSIVEMVAGLDRETAARYFVEKLSDEEVNNLIAKHEIEADEGETVEELRNRLFDGIEEESIEPDGFEFDEDAARQAIEEDALSLEVRSGWYSPGSEDNKPEEFCLLLGTGGPAVRIIGDLDGGSPSNPKLQTQDWFTPWTDYHTTSEEDDILQKYCEVFYFGE